jgi:hypothetical protein
MTRISSRFQPGHAESSAVMKASVFSHQLSAKALSLYLYISISLCLIVLLAACVPAHEPDVLKATPGPSVVVTDQVYKNSILSVRYPAGWSVQTSPASQPPSVIFLAPDEISSIKLQTGLLEFGGFSDPAFKIDIRGLTLPNGVKITAVLRVLTGSYNALLPVFEQVLSTVQAA